MGEPVSITASIFSGLNTVVRAISLVAHYREVPREVKQLHTNIEKAEKSINIAQRLLRSKNHYLDPRLVQETQASIEATNSALLLLRDSIEACRKDLELQETVTAKNRIAWVLWKNQEFLSQLQTLGNWLHALDRDIVRLEMAQPTLFLINDSPMLPSYADSNRGQENLIGMRGLIDGDIDQKASCLRSPTKRLRSSSNNSSKVDLMKQHLVGRSSDPPFPITKDGDEGYESDNSVYRSPPRGSPIMGDERSEETTEQISPLVKVTIGIGTPDLCLPISHGQLNARQVQPSAQAFIAAPSTVPSTLELPATNATPQAQEIPELISHSFTSKNPWHKFTKQPSRSTLNSITDSYQGQEPLHHPEIEGISLPTAKVCILDNGQEDIANNLLRLSVTAPTSHLASKLTRSSDSPDIDWKKQRWRRKSDFI